MYLHKTEDVNTKKVKQLQTQYVYLTINRKATLTATCICGKCKSFKHFRHKLGTEKFIELQSVFFLHKSLLKRTFSPNCCRKHV